MEAIILAAGEGSRMGDLLGDRPKIFLEIDGEKLYNHQIEVLDAYVEKITIAVGHGFESCTNPENSFDFPTDISADIDIVVVENACEHENAYTAMKLIEEANQDVMLICGDVIFSDEVVDKLTTEYLRHHQQNEQNVVGAINGTQDKMTAVQLDNEGRVTKYGKVTGHQEIGMFIIHQSHLSEAVNILSEDFSRWFPVIFERLPSFGVFVKEEYRHEMNTPEHFQSAQMKFGESC